MTIRPDDLGGRDFEPDPTNPQGPTDEPPVTDDLSLTCSDCGHEHVNGNSGSCSKFTCDCREWVAPIAGAAPVTAGADDTRPRPVKGL